MEDNLVVQIRCSSKEQKKFIMELLKECKEKGGFTYPAIIYRALKSFVVGL